MHKTNYHVEDGEEWLVTNGLGGFACGMISGIPARKYHSYLNASLPEPFGRTAMLSHVLESIILEDDTEVALTAFREYKSNVPHLPLKQFHLDHGIPVWTYEIDTIIIQKKLFLVYRQNTLHVTYELISPHKNLRLKWRPYFHFRVSEDSLNDKMTQEYTVHVADFQYEIECPPFPTLRIYNTLNAPFTSLCEIKDHVFYSIEADRGYKSLDKLISPGYFICPLERKVNFIASTETWSNIHALSSSKALITEKIRKKNLIQL